MTLTRQTMCEWVGVAADWLRLIDEAIGRDVLAGGYVQIDETPIRYLEPGHGHAKLAYFFGPAIAPAPTPSLLGTRAAPPPAWRRSCRSTSPASSSAMATPPTMPLRATARRIELAGCWAHVGRKFFETHLQGCRRADLVLHLLQNLCRTEKKLRETRAAPQVRALTRALECAPQSYAAAALPAPAVAKGAAHPCPKACWVRRSATPSASGPPSCSTSATAGSRSTTTLVENAIRPTALGKKNWLFIGAAHAGERRAVIDTIIESCRRHGIDPYAYLRDALSRLPSMTTTRSRT